MDITNVVAIDPGTASLGVAHLASDGDTTVLVDTVSVPKIGWTPDDVKDAGRQINAAWVRNKELRWKDVDVVLEMPAPRFYGRSNQATILRICWQVVRFVEYFCKKARSVNVVDSYMWNRRINPETHRLEGQYNDADKLEIFKTAFPEFLVDRPRMSPFSTVDCRDAALLGLWWLSQEKFEDESPSVFEKFLVSV